MSLLLAARAVCASSLVDDVERGRDAVREANVSALPDTASRAGAVDALVDHATQEGEGYLLGARLAGLGIELDKQAGPPGAGDRAILARQAGEVLKSQAKLGLGNRALCLLSGRPDPVSIERLLRLAEPGWSCAQGHAH